MHPLRSRKKKKKKENIEVSHSKPKEMPPEIIGKGFWSHLKPSSPRNATPEPHLIWRRQSRLRFDIWGIITGGSSEEKKGFLSFWSVKDNFTSTLFLVSISDRVLPPWKWEVRSVRKKKEIECGDERKKKGGGKDKNWQLLCRKAAGMRDDLDTQTAHLYILKKKKEWKKDAILSLKIFIKLWPTGRSASGNHHLLIYHVFHQADFDGVKVQEPAIRSHKT